MNLQAHQERPVRVQTVRGEVSGSLQVAARLRTLDDLNVVSKGFLTVHGAKTGDGAWPFAEGAVSINKSSILFVAEQDGSTPSHADFGNCTRASVHLRVGPFEIRGFVHVPPGGVVMKRLDQNNRPFLALTAAFVSGLGTEFTAAFLAVNRDHVVMAQELDQEVAAVPPVAVLGSR